MPHSTWISVVSSDLQLSSHIQLRLHSKGYQTNIMNCVDSDLGVFYSDSPDLLIKDISNDAECGIKLLSALRSESFFSAIPILGLVGAIDNDTFNWDN